MSTELESMDRRERVTATWVVTDDDGAVLPEVTLTLSTGRDETWHVLTRTSDTQWTALLAGPDATGNPDGTVVLGLGVHDFAIRSDETLQVLIEHAGTVSVY